MSNKIQKLNRVMIWGGIECTINRVNNHFLDQLQLAQYYEQPERIHEIISTGVKTIRFPVLWEKHEPVRGTEINWEFTNNQLSVLRKNDITPIAGLLHHGSGPAFTHLLDPDFPNLFADYASQVANQFPWIKYYTPINEPLTTARFSGLYGIWYPHKKNDVSFIKMLLNQLKATVLAMTEIRKINPEARLVQTEDLGKTYSTASLSYQAVFENHRRWLTYDILCGKMRKGHALWEYFMRLGIEEQNLRFFIDNPCIPDIIGVNHYITSERYLDEHVDQFPFYHVGGNGIHHYVDIEAIRVRMFEPHGINILLKEIWERYRIPLAITEVHLHCTREEQLRWFKEVYDIAVKLTNEGVDIIAVTAWALFGSFGWSTLLTCDSNDCEYETGTFDISSGYARPTALASLINSLTRNQPLENYVLGQPGWWKRDTRYLIKGRQKDYLNSACAAQPIIILGKTGTLGNAFSRICTERNLHHYILDRSEADICNSEQLEAVINHYHPWTIINTAGFVNVDEAEMNNELCYRENYLGPQKLSILCEKYKVKLVGFSSDLVFDGKKTEPYTEADIPNAINIYGHSKQLMEAFCKNVNPSSLIIRTSAFFSPWDKYNFVYSILSGLTAGEKRVVADDTMISPTYVPHLVHATLNLLIDNESGIWHLINKGSLTWFRFAKLIAAKAGLNPDLIQPGYNLGKVAMRPRNSSLISLKYNQMPDLNVAMDQYFASYNSTVTENITAG